MCYESVTRCYRYVTTYYISITEVLRTVNMSAPYPIIGPGWTSCKLQAGTGPPLCHKLQAGKAGSHELERTGQLDTVYKLETSWEINHTQAGWDHHSSGGKLEQCAPKILLRQAGTFILLIGTWEAAGIGFSVGVNFRAQISHKLEPLYTVYKIFWQKLDFE